MFTLFRVFFNNSELLSQEDISDQDLNPCAADHQRMHACRNVRAKLG